VTACAPRLVVRRAAPGLQNATFECRLDDVANWTSCGPAPSFANFAEGTHSLKVRAVAGPLVDDTPAIATWEVDLTRPRYDPERERPDPVFEAVLRYRPWRVGLRNLQENRSATFTLASDEPGALECRLDGSAWSNCGEPTGFSALSFGAQRFEARAIDAAGNIQATPAVATWSVSQADVATPGVCGVATPASVTFADRLLEPLQPAPDLRTLTLTTTTDCGLQLRFGLDIHPGER
jgi:hypothetical protein